MQESWRHFVNSDLLWFDETLRSCWDLGDCSLNIDENFDLSLIQNKIWAEFPLGRKYIRSGDQSWSKSVKSTKSVKSKPQHRSQIVNKQSSYPPMFFAVQLWVFHWKNLMWILWRCSCTKWSQKKKKFTQINSWTRSEDGNQRIHSY